MEPIKQWAVMQTWGKNSELLLNTNGSLLLRCSRLEARLVAANVRVTCAPDYGVRPVRVKITVEDSK